MSINRSYESLGSEALVPPLNRKKPVSVKGDPIASHGSGSPYVGDYQHDAVKSGPIGEQGGEAHGYTSRHGSTISLNESDGGDAINITHHTGAGVIVENDGSIYLQGSSMRGIGLSAPRGDIAVAGMEIAINAKGGITLRTNGPIIFESSDVMFKTTESFTIQAGSKHELVNGSSTTEVAKDNNVIIGGINRTTVAGDERHQVTGSRQDDIGKGFDLRSGANSTFQTTGTLAIKSSDAMTVSSKDKMDIVASDDMKVHTGATLDVVGTSSIKESTGGDYEVDASGTLDLKSSSTSTLSGSSAARVLGTTTTVSGTTVNIGASVYNAPEAPGGTASTVAPLSPSVTSASSATDPAKAQVATANTIIDEITSARQVPGYPRNAKYETEDAAAITIVSHDTSDDAEQAYELYSSKNKGTRFPVTQGSYGSTVDPSTYSTYDQAPPIAVSSSELVGQAPASDLNANDRIEGSSLSEIVHAPFSWPIPDSLKESVLKAHAILLQNVIAPLRAAGFNFTVNSGYRANSPNHVTGYAVDLQVPGRLLAKHLEIAVYAARNLPVSQVFIERSGSGFTHVHLRAHPPGSSGAPSLLTCGDPKCRSRISGLSAEYLIRRGVRGA